MIRIFVNLQYMLLTKLHIPPAGNNIVHRSGLFEKLNTGLSRKLILVSAPAGFGKTTVVSDWINQNKIPAAWFSLDNGDNDPVDFLKLCNFRYSKYSCSIWRKCPQTVKFTQQAIRRINCQPLNQRNT